MATLTPASNPLCAGLQARGGSSGDGGGGGNGGAGAWPREQGGEEEGGSGFSPELADALAALAPDGDGLQHLALLYAARP